MNYSMRSKDERDCVKCCRVVMYGRGCWSRYELQYAAKEWCRVGQVLSCHDVVIEVLFGKSLTIKSHRGSVTRVQRRYGVSLKEVIT